MLTYNLFGISLRSELELPELTAAPAQPSCELIVRCAPPSTAHPLHDDEGQVQVTDDQVVLTYPGVGAFVLRPAERSIDVSIEPGAERLVSLPLLGPVMAVYLHLSGKLVLHASAVRQDGYGVAFVGDKGAGKSTTAAACVKAGAELITDDLLVCASNVGERARCEPGFSQLKLNADAALALPLQASDRLPSPHPAFTKQILRLPDIPRAATPLAAICELTRGERLELSRLPAPEALGVVLGFTYVGRYGATFLSGVHGSAHFRRSADLVGCTPVWRLQAPGSIAELERAMPEVLTVLGADRLG